MLRREQDRLDEIDALIRLSVDEYPGYRSFRCFVVLIDCALGRDEHARREFDDLARDDFSALPRDGEWLFCLSLMAEVASYLDDRERAATLYRLLAPYANLNALAAGEVASGSVSRYLGLSGCGHGSGEARRHFEDALEANVRMGARCVGRPYAARLREDAPHNGTRARPRASARTPPRRPQHGRRARNAGTSQANGATRNSQRLIAGASLTKASI